MKNFAVEVRVILSMEGTIPDGRTEKLGKEAATTQFELGLGPSLAINKREDICQLQ